MKRQFMTLFFCVSALFLCESCIVSYINTDTLKQNYEKKIHHTTLLGKLLFKTDKRKIDTYDHVQVFLNESEVGRDFEVKAYGSYTPLTLPIIRPERPRLEKYLLWKAARKARKLHADGVIIDNKNDFRVIKFK
jgi:hypothetical protein